MYSNYSFPQRMCLYETTETCVPQYPPNDVCDAVTPGCTCYRWAFAGVSNTTVVRVSDFQAELNCIDFVILNAGTVDFYFEMTSVWPELPPGLYFPLISNYEKWPMRHSLPLSWYAQKFMLENCIRDLFDGVAECSVRHTLPIVAGRPDWQSQETPGKKETNIERSILVAFASILVASFFIVFGVAEFKQ